LVKKTGKRVKHIPLRTCIGCREVIAKKAMTRIVRTPDGIKLTHPEKQPEEEHISQIIRSCWEKALKGQLSRALKTDLTEKDREELLSFMAGLLEDETLEESADETNAIPAE
jgi:uncharacterized protein